jgi:hypothetical protein
VGESWENMKYEGKRRERLTKNAVETIRILRTRTEQISGSLVDSAPIDRTDIASQDFRKQILGCTTSLVKPF